MHDDTENMQLSDLFHDVKNMTPDDLYSRP